MRDKTKQYNIIILKCGNEKRDKRLEVVKLLTALSYCVDGSFILSVFSISIMIASLLSDACQRETFNRGWVGMGWWVSGFLLGVYKDTTHRKHFLVKPCASVQNLVGGCAGGLVFKV